MPFEVSKELEKTGYAYIEHETSEEQALEYAKVEECFVDSDDPDYLEVTRFILKK